MANYKDSDYMKYNLQRHRYVITSDAMLERYGINLNDALDSNGVESPDLLTEHFLDRVSLVLYNYIYSWAQDKSDTEYVISLLDYREALEDAMCELCYAWLSNNTDPSLFFTGNTLKTIEVPPAVQTILMNNGLLFRGEYLGLPNNYKSMRGIDY